MSELTRPKFIIRPLSSDDTEHYRNLRQFILSTSDAGYFSDSYERERALDSQGWLQWCTETEEHCILGTFADDDLVGIIMVSRQGGPASRTVEWEAAWLHPRYRGSGIGKKAYDEARLWSERLGYRFVVGFIRAVFTPALEICRGQGFVYAYSISNELWADGTVGDTHAFLLDLQGTQADSDLPVTVRFAEAIKTLANSSHPPHELRHVKVA